MVHALEEEQENYKSKLNHFRGINVNNNAGAISSLDHRRTKSQASLSPSIDPIDKRNDGYALNCNDVAPRSPLLNDVKHPSDMDMMKERFAKLLLGEDMSGGGKGVSSALALSNAITNLAASVFGEQKRLEPMTPERKARWKKEIDWLLSVSDQIVEMVPSKQKSKDGTQMEIMTTRQRTDLLMNIPALRKLDAMLILDGWTAVGCGATKLSLLAVSALRIKRECLENFRGQNEFSYLSKDDKSEKGKIKRADEKWWIPVPKVPQNGLSDVTKKWLQFQKDSVNQVLKAAMAINAQVISEMAIPESYIESLPKNGRASLGDSIYKNITIGDYFDPDHFLTMMDLSSEHKILDLKNRIEASVVIWKRKMHAKDSKSPWGSAVSLEKRELFEERAETILLIIKHRFPGLPQSSLEISKIQFNRDVGQAILESYSRILESLAFTVMSRIEDVLQADYLAQNPGEKKRHFLSDTSISIRKEDFPILSSADMPESIMLSDFMGWDQGDSETKKEITDSLLKEDDKSSKKPGNIVTKKKFSYMEKLGGIRSPTARH